MQNIINSVNIHNNWFPVTIRELLDSRFAEAVLTIFACTEKENFGSLRLEDFLPYVSWASDNILDAYKALMEWWYITQDFSEQLSDIIGKYKNSEYSFNDAEDALSNLVFWESESSFDKKMAWKIIPRLEINNGKIIFHICEKKDSEKKSEDFSDKVTEVLSLLETEWN